MYYDYFGLKQPPFKITPDTSMFFPGGNRGAILDALIYAILNGEGIIKVVGEVGSGKTMLCRMLEKELPGNIEVVYIANPSLSPENILHAIAFDLNLDVRSDTSRLEVMNKLQEYLLGRHGAGKQVVVFIEEAQSMPIATLEEIRLLSNLETGQNKLLQIVLFGQPELDEMVGKREIRQLKERITYSFQLNPFNADEIRDYLNARLRSCGHRSREIFNDKAVRGIERYSKGLVRRINILADKSMLAAYAGNNSSVNAAHVKQAAMDSEFVRNPVLKYRLPSVFTSLMVLAVAVVFWLNEPDDRAGQLQASALVAGPDRPEPQLTSVAEKVDPQQSRVADAPVSPVKEMADTGQEDLVSSIVKPEIHSQIDEEFLVGPDGDNIKDKLMGLEAMIQSEAMTYEKYTDRELQILREQLEKLPPEVAYHAKSSPESDTCNLCWSIIYRPLAKPDNL